MPLRALKISKPFEPVKQFKEKIRGDEEDLCQLWN